MSKLAGIEINKAQDFFYENCDGRESVLQPLKNLPQSMFRIAMAFAQYYHEYTEEK